MQTECKQTQMDFQAFESRKVVGDFDGGHLSSDGGLALLREMEGKTKIIHRFTDCFEDYRNQEYVEHELFQLIAQKTYGLIQGYEDLNDHDSLRRDPLLALACGKTDIEGNDRRREEDRGKPLAGKSTLNRLELGAKRDDSLHRYHKILCNFEKVDQLLLELFFESQTNNPEVLVIVVDATDNPLHGKQEGRFFNGYYDEFCYLPLYMFCGDQLLLARLQTSDVDAAQAGQDEIERVILAIRRRFPKTLIIVRGDGGFCRDELMAFCERLPLVKYVLGLPKNKRLLEQLAPEMKQARTAFEVEAKPQRVFSSFDYQTLNTWSKSRRVVGKAETNENGDNPRFVVTSLNEEQWTAQSLYEDLYCARGNMENRLKEQQMGLFSDRTSTHWLDSNQLRIYFSAIAYTVLCAFRTQALKNTKYKDTQSWNIRNTVLKVAVRIQISVRRVKLSFPSSFPYAEQFRMIFNNIQRMPMRV